MQVSGTKGRDSGMAEMELVEGTCVREVGQFSFEKGKSLRNLVFTSQRNTTQSADLYLRINVN